MLRNQLTPSAQQLGKTMRAKTTPHIGHQQAGPPSREMTALKHEAWAPSPNQIKNALELIKPTRHQTMCEHDIRVALESVEYNKIMFTVSPSAYKKNLHRLVKKLRAIGALDSTAVGIFIGQDCMNRLKFVRRGLEQTADKIRLRHGSRRLSASKECTTICAYALLVKFRQRPPGLTRGGTWHNLSSSLYGAGQTDLFDYMIRFRNTPLYNYIRARTGVLAAQQAGRTATKHESFPGCCDYIVFGPSTGMIAPDIVT
jgi:hypothetical protein